MARNNGLPTILRNFQIYSKRLKEDLVFEVAQATTSIENKAKTNVVVDTGKLKQSIYHKMDYQKGLGEVGATEDYAPYIEFGTGGKVDVPNGYSDFAIQFKGKGKKQINRGAKPFLIPAFLEGKDKLKQATENTVSKYSGLKSIKRL